MTKIKTIIFTLSTICSLAFGQTKSDFLIGDWIEIRREERSGYVYTIGGALNEPTIEFSFLKNGTCTFYNPRTPDPKSTHQYLLLGDTLLSWKGEIRMRIADVIKIDKDNFVIVIRSMNSYKGDNDLKCYFIRKDKYNKLSQADITKLRAPTKKDIAYKDSITARRSKNYIQPKPNFVLITDVMPQFPGGYDSLKKFVKKNLVYPKSLTKEGNVFVQFIVETDGKLSNIIVLQGLSPDSDKEALRIVKLMPTWKPGYQNNKTVRVQTSIPIMFRQ